MHDPDELKLVKLTGAELREVEGLNLADLDDLPDAPAKEVDRLLRRIFPRPPPSWWDSIGNVDEMKKKLRRDGLL